MWSYVVIWSLKTGPSHTGRVGTQEVFATGIVWGQHGWKYNIYIIMLSFSKVSWFILLHAGRKLAPNPLSFGAKF